MVNRLILWLICLITMVACSSAPSNTLNGTTWQLRSIDGAPIPADVNATIGFVDGQFSGNSGCNSYGGTYVLDNATIAFTLNQMSMMACMGSGGDVEQLFMATLPQTTNLVMSDARDANAQLTLQDDRLIPRLVFVRITPN